MSALKSCESLSCELIIMMLMQSANNICVLIHTKINSLYKQFVQLSCGVHSAVRSRTLQLALP